MNGPPPSEPLLALRNLTVTFKTAKNTAIEIIQEINLDVFSGERIAIVGESGSGKTVTAMSLMRLLDDVAYSGEIIFNGVNLLSIRESEMRKIRGKEIAMTFQDSLSTLNPIMRIGDQIMEPLLIRGIKKKQARVAGCQIMRELGFLEPEKIFDHYPHQFSGGMRQRVMMAIALIGEPSLLIADEPTTALDVRIQAQVMDILNELTFRRNLTVILISHDLGVVAGFADRVVVMYAGQIVESGNSEDIFYSSRHPYTRGLSDSIPSIDRSPDSALQAIPGVTPEPSARPSGCVFQNRCSFAQDICRETSPPMFNASESHQYACFFPLEQSRELGVLDVKSF